MCKKCFSALDINTTTLVTPQDENNDDDSSSSDSEMDSDDSLIEPHVLDDGNLDFDGCEQGNNNPLLEDGHVLSDDFLTTTHDADIPIIEGDDIGLYQGCQGDDVPTTNAGDTVLAIEEETAYGGSFGNIKISGHVLLNQCGTLLSH